MLDALARKLDTPGRHAFTEDISGARTAAMEKAPALFDRIADRYSRLFAVCAFGLLNLVALVSRFTGARGLPAPVVRAGGGGDGARDASASRLCYGLHGNDRAMVSRA